MIRFVSWRELAYVVLLAIAAASLGCEDAVSVPPRFGVAVVNLWDSGDAGNYYVRQQATAITVRDRLASEGLPLDLVGLSECRSRQVSANPPWPERMVGSIKEPIQIPCPTLGRDAWSEECFAAELTTDAMQFRGRGHVGDVCMASGGSAVPAPAPPFVCALALNFGYVPNTNQRAAIGRAFYVPGIAASCDGGWCPLVVSLFVAHINTDQSLELYRKAQIATLIDCVKSMYKPGQVTPIVVGDFNYYPADTPHMRECFVEIGYENGIHEYDHIWVGKRSCFPDAGACVKAVNYRRYEELRNPSLYSDHPGIYAEFETGPCDET